MPRKKTTTPKTSKPKSKAPVAKTRKPTTKQPSAQVFPIVGLGASAGGLEALKSFFSGVKESSGMAYVVVVHMTPQQPSLMPDLLQKVSPIPVSAAKDRQTIESDQVYVIPPDKDISVFKGKIQLLDSLKKGVRHPIDLFFRSLSQDQGNKAAAIILSGTGTDGTLGIKEIKGSEGLVLVQNEESAGYDGMPRSAISTGLVDIVLPPEEMPKKLIDYFSHPATNASAATTTTTTDEQQEWLNKIFAILRTHIGHDFSVYKTNTILRRIGRRMGLNHIDSHKTYVRYLRENPSEIESLFRELLIGVTNFFRDADSFNVLKTNILPELFETLKEDATFRAWIPGCSTGEEVYSLAIVFREVIDKNPRRINLQLFGTDIDNHAIDKAREGIFPASISADISKDRLKRFFIKEGDFYRIRKEIRDCVVFSVQDVIKDPPFSRLDLLCCRNLLIYLDTDAQKKLLPLFHYTLKPSGILVLGSSETIGGFRNLFETLDKKWKIFRRQEVPQALRQIVEFPSGPSSAEPTIDKQPAIAANRRADINLLTQKAILDQFAPTAILINGNGDIMNVQGRTGKYLETPSGPPTNNILDLAREGLRIELSSALRTAKSTSQNVVRKRIAVKTNGDVQLINLHVCPQKVPQELAGRLLVVFEDIDTDHKVNDSGTDKNGTGLPDASRIAKLERELQVTRESHQTTIEELESSNEELKSTNEEMQSSNEELQSTNEELESSKEELQSLNEELQTVNSELQSKVEELSAAHDDMRNLMNSTEIATIFVDNDMRIKRFTAEATRIVNLIQTDVGRPLQHVVSNLKYGKMIEDLTEVLKKLAPKECEVQTAEENWFNMRIIPYRTTDNRIDGAVLTFSSIDDQKKAHGKLENTLSESDNAWKLVRAIFDIGKEPMAVLDKAGRIVIANTQYTEFMNVDQDNLKGIDFLQSHKELAAKIGLQTKLKTALKEDKDFSSDMIKIKTPSGAKSISITGRVLKKDKDFPYRILIQFKSTN
jgi:two-component system CheB/CheR fusion protein